MEYSVSIKEQLCRTIKVSAENEILAIKSVRSQYNKEKIVLDWEDFVDVDFCISNEQDYPIE